MLQDDDPFGEDALESALSELEVFLRARRLKMTEQRRTMAKAALSHHGHFTAEELHRALGNDGEAVSLATVYRGLAVLEDAALVEGHDFADGTRRYERAVDRQHHDHMVCVDCRAVIEFTNEKIERLQQQVVEAHGFTMKDHSLTLFVRCNVWRADGACERRAEREARRKAAGLG
ncbi:MAG: Fur family transcriptional regulator [Planctomycetota bacterium]|nr:Fur family transcriptional regulator [Planctomycetota bacterium]